jgi:hypothetical protein
MLQVKDCFMPYRNSMAEFIEPSREVIRQEKLQAADNKITPYDVFGRGDEYGEPLPDCLTQIEE